MVPKWSGTRRSSFSFLQCPIKLVISSLCPSTQTVIESTITISRCYCGWDDSGWNGVCWNVGTRAKVVAEVDVVDSDISLVWRTPDSFKDELKKKQYVIYKKNQFLIQLYYFYFHYDYIFKNKLRKRVLFLESKWIIYESDFKVLIQSYCKMFHWFSTSLLSCKSLKTYSERLFAEYRDLRLNPWVSLVTRFGPDLCISTTNTSVNIQLSDMWSIHMSVEL